MAQTLPFDNTAPSLMPSPSLRVLTVCKLATTQNEDIQGLVEGNTIDGVALIEGDSVLFKNQTTASDNGVYVLTAQGFTRREDFDSAGDVAGGAIVPIDKGTVNGGKAFEIAQPGGALGDVDIVLTEYLSWQGPESISVADQTFDNTAPDPASVTSQTFDNTAPDAASVADQTFDNTPPESMS